MREITGYEEFLIESLFADAEEGATKGIGYGTPEKARKTCEIADRMKKTDPGKAVQIVTSMMNRAKYSNGQNDDMRAAIPIFKKWLDANKSD